MKKIIFVFIYVFLNFSICLSDEFDDFSPPEYPNGLYLEIGGGENQNSSWGELGFLGTVSDYFEYRASLGYLGLEPVETSDKEYYGGINIGTRIKYSSFITPFLGAGIFSGYSFENKNAENDGIDNDNDNIVDEENEKKEVSDDVIFCFYPEAGFYFQFQNNSKIYFSAKYMISTEKEADNFYLFTIGFSFSYEEETVNF
jgi:hypothetical protein